MENWQAVMSDPVRKPKFEQSLENSLTPAIAHYLPLSMAYPGEYAGIDAWIKDRLNELYAYTVHRSDTEEFLGLVLLFPDNDDELGATLYIGYFYHEDSWGNGYASEALGMVVDALSTGPETYLFAGVDVENIASANVLRKVGFTRVSDKSTAGRHYFERMVP